MSSGGVYDGHRAMASATATKAPCTVPERSAASQKRLEFIGNGTFGWRFAARSAAWALGSWLVAGFCALCDMAFRSFPRGIPQYGAITLMPTHARPHAAVERAPGGD